MASAPPHPTIHTTPATNFTLHLTHISISSGGSSRVSRSLKLIIDGQRRTCVFQTHMLSWVMQWKVHPSVTISSASSMTVQPYQPRLFSRLPILGQKKKPKPVSISGDAVLRACSDESGDSHEYVEQGAEYQVTLKLTSSKVPKVRKATETDTPDGLLSATPTADALLLFPEIPSPSLYFRRSGGILKNLKTFFKNYSATENAESTLKALEMATEALSAGSGDEGIQTLGEDICDLLSYLAKPQFRSMLESETDTVSSILLAIANAAVFAEDYVALAPRESDKPFESRQDTLSAFQRFEVYRRPDNESDEGNELVEKETVADELLYDTLLPRDARDEIADIFFLEGTRKSVLDQILEWADNYEAETPNILWLTGAPGSGKTAVASTLISELLSQHRCGGSFYFRRSSVFPYHVWRTISYGLASFHPALKSHIHTILTKETVEINEVLPCFEKLIVEPLTNPPTMDHLTQKYPVIVLDGLDESDRWSYAGDWPNLLDTLGRWNTLSHNVKLVVTSRVDEAILRVFDGKLVKRVDISTGVDVDPYTSDDIHRYLEHRLREIRTQAQLPSTWPQPELVVKIERHAAGLFIWAKAAMDFIAAGRDDREKKFSAVIAGGTRHKYPSIDTLYRQILSFAFTDLKPVAGYHATIGALALAKAPLTIQDLQSLFDDRFKSDPPEEVCRKLCVMIYTGSDNHISIRHQSFAEFLMDSERCSKDHSAFLIDRRRASRNFVIACLQLMLNEEKGLRFNICGLQSSHIANVDVPGLDDIVSKNISSALLYACKYWADHLRDYRETTEKRDVELVDLLRRFLRTRLLYWIEVLSLVDAVDTGLKLLLFTADWLEETDKELSSFAKDASRFILISRDPIQRSVPHIYLSALAFAPTESEIAKPYRLQFPSILEVKGILPDHSPALRFAWWPMSGGNANAVAYSSDGKRVFSGMSDGSIRAWNPETGDCLLTMDGHTSAVLSIAVSARKRLVSGSRDMSVRVWDMDTGILLFGPFQGHRDWVRSVAISGSKVASASDDRTVRIWNLEATQSNSLVLEGHSDYVQSVAFSPDTKRVVSGGDDRTIRVWDAEERGLLLEPFTGHTGFVRSVAFSPDGILFVSGSEDGSIRLWESSTGNQHGQLFQGHSNYVASVAFDGTSEYVLSGSYDKTLRSLPLDFHQTESMRYRALNRTIVHSGFGTLAPYSELWRCQKKFYSFQLLGDGESLLGLDGESIWTWEIEAGTVTTRRLDKETRRHVCTAVLSRDGTRAATSEDDRLIRIWDVESGQRILKPLVGHTGDAYTLAFSPDGTKLVSGSDDQTIRIWDMDTGDCLCGPLQGHTADIRAMAFSLDSTRILSGSLDNTARMWDVAGGTAIFEPLTKHSESVQAVAFSSKYIATGSDDGNIYIWDAETGAAMFQPLRVSTAPSGTYHYAVAFSPDENHSLYVFDIETARTICGPLRGHRDVIQCASFSPDGSRVISASSDGTIRVWDAQYPNAEPKVMLGHSDWIHSVSISPDGHYVASGSDDNAVIVQNLATGISPFPTLEKDEQCLCSVSFSPTDEHLIAGSDDSIIYMWNARTGESLPNVFRGHEDHVRSLAFSTNGQCIASGSDDETVRIWDTCKAPADALMKTFYGRGGWVYSVAFSPDEGRVVSGSADGVIRLLDMKSGGEPVRTFEGHAGPVLSVLFCPVDNGRRILSGSDDETIRLWDADTGELTLKPLVGHSGPVCSVAVSRDGGWLVSGSKDATIRIWNMQTVSPMAIPMRAHTDRVLSIYLLMNA
ncbi:hypothetical protein EW146_g6562 [Bondarzewia mesenterica]|uniref:NACHT domain-containing protein n=1 Tax=Bondarzewia mesenterica TaxID=1095465 RepID=A0A4S4LP44_9AGAM|nr:hypothetical protein EW146_g6562 [Bondarzewia mesenterica]